MEKMLLRPLEAAHTLDIGRTKIYELIASGEIPSVKIGRLVRVPVHALQRWVEQQNRDRNAGSDDSEDD